MDHRILTSLILIATLAGCTPSRPTSLKEAASKLKLGMTEQEVETLLGGSGPGEGSTKYLGKPYYPFPVSVPETPANERTYYVSPKHALVVCYLDDRLVAWNLDPNLNPLFTRSAKLRIGQSLQQVREIMGPYESNYPRWNGKFIERRLCYSEGSSSPYTGSRRVEIDLQKDIVVSIRQGKWREMSIRPYPWEPGWFPIVPSPK